MGILRGIGKHFGSFLFTTGIVLTIVMVGLVSFTSYENLKPVLAGMISSMTGQADPASLNLVMLALRQQCVGKESIAYPISGGETITIRCSDVNKADANINDIITTAMADKIYYKQYSCSFLDCIKSGEVGIIVSAQGSAFFKTLQTASIVVAAFGVVLILISAETWPARLKSLGVPMIFIGVPYFINDDVILSLLKRLVPGLDLASGIMGERVSSMLSGMFEPMESYFLCFLIAGIVVTALGYVLGYMKKRSEGKKAIKKK